MIITYHLGIELTQKCNLDCRHCFRGESTEISITEDIVRKIFNEVKYVEILDLSGGEVFLAYHELKMVLDIASELGITINRCNILTNGTVYDQRIYDLLDKFFNGNYQVGISDDDFHEKSIKRKYGHNPQALEKVLDNISRHLNNSHCVGYYRVSNRLIDNGRALNVSTPKKQFEALGYYYSIHNGIMFSGPMIFIGAEGYISDINSDIHKRKEQSLGNILNITIKDAIERGAIRKPFDSKNPFSHFIKREQEFYSHNGDHLGFENNRLVPIPYEVDPCYLEAVSKVREDIESFREALRSGNIEEFFQHWDPVYNGDLSQIDHEYQKQ